MSEFLTVYPGVYLPEESEALENIRKQIAANLSRKDMSFSELVATSDGSSAGVPYRVTAGREEVQAQMRTLDPWNPIWFDEAYAKNTPYGGLPAPEGWSCPKGGYFGGMNRNFGDLTCVKEHHHYCTFFAPVLQGDTLYPVLIDQDVWDATPYGGSEFRTWALRGTANVYNQRGELVLRQTCGVEDCFKIYQEPARRTWNAEHTDVWDEPEFANHAIHHYTDADWETIRDLWSQEDRAGSRTLYWEDVQIGDLPPVTVDGPYTAPGKGGMIMSTSAPSRSSWYLREHWGEPELTAVLQKDDCGIYHVPELDALEAEENRRAMEGQMKNHPHPDKPGEKRPEPPKGGKPPVDNSPVAVRGKATFDNFTGRDSALRAIHNWIGDNGFITALSWCIGAHPDMQQGIPSHPNRRSPFVRVPGMEDRHTEVHGEEGDLSVNRLYVTDKYVDEQGRHLVDLTWWCETIEGQIHTEGTATVALPTKG